MKLNPFKTGKKKVAPPLAESVEMLRELSPEDLAERAAAGSLGAYGELVGRFEARVFNFLLRKMGNRADAEDLTQEAFVRAWERIESFDRQWRFSTWLFTIASRLAVSHHRRQRPNVGGGDLDRAAAGTPEASGTSDADRALGARLWALAAGTLGPDQHEALWLRYAEDLSIPEIARVMGKSNVGVRVCLFRARQSLAESLNEAGGAGVAEGPMEVVVRRPVAQPRSREAAGPVVEKRSGSATDGSRFGLAGGVR